MSDVCSRINSKRFNRTQYFQNMPQSILSAYSLKIEIFIIRNSIRFNRAQYSFDISHRSLKSRFAVEQKSNHVIFIDKVLTRQKVGYIVFNYFLARYIYSRLFQSFIGILSRKSLIATKEIDCK